MKELKLQFGGCVCDYNERGRVTHITKTNIYGVNADEKFEYDDKGHLIKMINHEDKYIHPAIITYEYDDYDRLIREVQSRRCYEDIVVTYEYSSDMVIKTRKHTHYINIKKTNSHGHIIYDNTEYKDNRSMCVTRDFDYDNNTFIEEIVWKMYENFSPIETSKRKYSFTDDEIKLIEEIS